MPSAEYHLRQAELAVRLANAEPDPDKARALHEVAVSFYEKTERANLRGLDAAGSHRASVAKGKPGPH